MIDWDDIRHFLAVVEHGSTRRAGDALGVGQTTTARRVKSLEDRLGIALFDRADGRYRPTADALALLPAAKAMRAASETFLTEGRGLLRHRVRRIKITAESAMTTLLVDPAIARFARLRPDIEVEVDVSADKRDLVAGQADVGLRGGYEPTEPDLIRRKLMDDPFAVYCSHDYPSPPTTREELRDHWIACFDVLRPRFEAGGLGHRVKHVANSATALRAIIAAGHAVGPLPRSVGEAPPALKSCFGVAEPIGVWLVYPERMRGFPGLKELSAAIAAEARRVTRSREQRPGPGDPR